ncbi:MAG: hypothetical protein OXD42_14595 [Rhodospirillaceae bacterium]|nr:hypothetical protein [Rhodospirillaceae bacterium]MCY4236788.1 hypothetical protein [Rhodospirillaceae bacterium]
MDDGSVLRKLLPRGGIAAITLFWLIRMPAWHRYHGSINVDLAAYDFRQGLSNVGCAAMMHAICHIGRVFVIYNC